MLGATFARPTPALAPSCRLPTRHRLPIWNSSASSFGRATTIGNAVGLYRGGFWFERGSPGGHGAARWQRRWTNNRGALRPAGATPTRASSPRPGRSDCRRRSQHRGASARYTGAALLPHRMMNDAAPPVPPAVRLERPIRTRDARWCARRLRRGNCRAASFWVATRWWASRRSYGDRASCRRASR